MILSQIISYFTMSYDYIGVNFVQIRLTALKTIARTFPAAPDVSMSNVAAG